MAYWGEAMTYNHPLWAEVDQAAALSALARLAPTPEARWRKAPTPREQAYLRAIDSLFGPGDKVVRDSHYEQSMSDLALAYPDDLDAISFHALALLGSMEGVRQPEMGMRAAGLAQRILLKNPEHPGALHYFIHAVDDPEHAAIGLAVADAYGRVASLVPHAVHMPSHIYGALGLWGLSARANEESWRLGELRVTAQGLPASAREYHSLGWLHDSYLQLQRYDDADKLLHIVQDDAEHDGNARARWSFCHMRAAQWFATNGKVLGSEAAPFAPVPADDLDISAAVADLFLRAMQALQQDKVAQAKQLGGVLQQKVELANHAPVQATSHCARTQVYGSIASLQAARVMALQLHGAILLHDGHPKAGFHLLEQSVQLSDALPYEDGPPMTPKLPHEFYADALLAHGKTSKALQQYQHSLRRYPKRCLSLQGLARAARILGHSDVAKQAEDLLATKDTPAK